VATPRVSEVLLDLADAADAYAVAVQDATTGPEILGTEGSSEIKAEKCLKWRHEKEPVRASHSAIRMGHFFVLDSYRSLARLTVAEKPSVYGPFVLARSLLDGAGWAYWLAQSGIGPDKRVQRGIALRIAEGNDQNVPSRSEFQEVRSQIKKDRENASEFCTHHGWAFHPGGRRQPPLLVGTESVPTRRRLIDEVLGVDKDEIDKGLGATLWWFLSGFSHGGLGGLLYAIEKNPDTDPTQGSGLIYVRADTFVWLLVACGRATIAITRRRMELLGDSTVSTQEREGELESQFVRYLSAVRQGQRPKGRT
jgi:hypothetical protein